MLTFTVNLGDIVLNQHNNKFCICYFYQKPCISYVYIKLLLFTEKICNNNNINCTYIPTNNYCYYHNACRFNSPVGCRMLLHNSHFQSRSSLLYYILEGVACDLVVLDHYYRWNVDLVEQYQELLLVYLS